MKKIAISCNKNNFLIYKIIHDKIIKTKNINSEIILLEGNINYEELLNIYDSIYIVDSFNKYNFNYKNKDKFPSYYIKENNEIIGYDTRKFAFEYLVNYHKIKLNNSKIVILETNEWFNSIYSYLKSNNVSKIYVASIFQNNKIKLENGDYFINYLDLNRIQNIDLLINLIPIGDYSSYEYLPFNNNLKSKNLIDTIIYPFDTALMKKMRLENTLTISGIYLAIIELLYILSISFSRNDIIYDEFIKQIFIKLENETNSNSKIKINKIDTSNEFLKLLKGSVK